MIAHTVVVGGNSDNKVTDKRANCFLAAHYASQAALRLMRPGNDVSTYYTLSSKRTRHCPTKIKIGFVLCIPLYNSAIVFPLRLQHLELVSAKK